ncbi:MAG: hypothetical protein AB7Q29_09940 [Vicinamibacterales bacterium]
MSLRHGRSATRRAALRVVQAAVMAWLAFSFVAQRNIGLADNGDYTRVMGTITSGPIGITANWPEPGTADWSRRFFSHWLPYWRLDWPLESPRTSAVLLWIPGAGLSAAMMPPGVLWMPLLGAPIKIALLVLIGLLLAWIERRAVRPLVSTTVIAVPFALLVSTTDVVAYINTFYREAASAVYLFAFIASLLWLRARPSTSPSASPRAGLCLILLALLMSAKPSNVYWGLIGAPLVFAAPTSGFTWRRGLYCVMVIAMLSAGALRLTSDYTNRTTVWDSLFSSALLASANPAAHLTRLGMPEASPCIGQPIFFGVGADCYQRYRDRVTPLSTVSVLAREPLVAMRQLFIGFASLHDLSIEWYGIEAAADTADDTAGNAHVPSRPAIEGPAAARFWGARSGRPLNVWSTLQYHVFPRGLLAVLLLLVLVPLWRTGARRGGIAADLAAVGMVASLAVPLDLVVEIGAEGVQDLIRHLFLANILFAIIVIAAAGLAVELLLTTQPAADHALSNRHLGTV